MLPAFSKIRSASRFIFAVSSAIALIWVGAIFWHDDASPTYANAVEAYHNEEYMESYSTYKGLVRSEAATDSTAIQLREMATALGKATESEVVSEEQGLREYLRLQREAYSIADSLGADSIKAEAAESIGNVVMYCTEEDLQCGTDPVETTDSSEESTYAKYTAPLGFVILVLAAIGILRLLFPGQTTKKEA